MLDQILKVCEAEKSKKYVLWGTKKGNPEYMEEILLSECSVEQAEKVMPMAKKDGYGNFRIVELDNSVPDFVATIN